VNRKSVLERGNVRKISVESSIGNLIILGFSLSDWNQIVAR